jgi:sugar phosphate isomerase/epimerase
MRNHCEETDEKGLAMSTSKHKLPALHNAMWPGIVGKGTDSEPAIDLDTMLRLTAAAELDGTRFDGVDLFLSLPHTDIDSTDDELKLLADKLAAHDLVAGSLVAPVWPPVGGGSAMGSEDERAKFLTQVRKACAIGKKLRDLGIRRYGVVRIDSAADPASWAKDPVESTKRIAETFREACAIANGYGERLAAEGEICWGGMHGWKHMVELLELVGQPKTLGFQADMAHTMLYTLGYNSPESRLLPPDYDWSDPSILTDALRQVAHALRPWTIDFHVAQNDGTVKGSGSHDKTGRHCPPDDPNGKMDIIAIAGLWMRNEDGTPTRAYEHICWDGCMFPNTMMISPDTWVKILATMIQVRNAHGWD